VTEGRVDAHNSGVNLSRGLRWILFVVGLSLFVGAAGFAWRVVSRPIVLPVAVGPAGYDDYIFASAFARALAADASHIRISLLATSGPVEAVAKLKSGEARLAIIRADNRTPESIRAVALLHSDPVVIVTPKGSNVRTFADLNDKALGVIGPPDANTSLLDRLRTHYRANFRTLDLPASAARIATAIRERKIEALLFVAPTARSAALAENWVAVRKASGRSLDFLALEDAEAVAAADPHYEEGEIAAGQFGGNPPLPKDSVTTLQVSTYLVADRSANEDQITQLTRFLFESRQKIGADSSIAYLVKAASTDKDAVIPVHPGAKTFYDGEEQTFLEKYSDWLYVGPVIFGAIASVLMAIARFLGITSPPQEPPLLARVPDVIRMIKDAKTPEELDAVREGIDAAVERLSMDAVTGNPNQENMGAISVAITHLHRLIADQRSALAQAAATRSSSPAPSPEETVS
jgi:TRAP transporter TAXI family solute receptor